ncbi:ATP-binding cassette domain-containing protein [Streptomyces olivaceus]|uniref:ATP-binding cassette domain-containing protein n=1 Tax=Streptomyces olivaceus TaxID=47716 RepID=UPI001CCAB32B|nr:ATP-binding cassette domain-containing protein [Streptomyces olivaceus]MBZ6230282.1 ATP-binding cassette domain-containing protein [Streptomyces olivaceus]
MATKSSALAIETSGLVKKFQGERVVDGIDLTVARGTVYGILGPNGAGKTTFVKILATLLQPDAGEARIFGKDVVKEAGAVCSHVSLTGQNTALDEDLTGMENMVLLGRLLGYSKTAARERAEQLLEAFLLSECAGRQVRTYSGGMRRRLDIAGSIFSTPDLLFLDEPTTGLDPRSRSQVWEIVRIIVAQGTTVLLTTQYLDEADQLAARIAVMDHGRVIAEGTKGELKASVGADSVHLRLRDAAQRPMAERLLGTCLNASVQQGPDPLALSSRISGNHGEPAAQASLVLAELSRIGISIESFSLGQPSLDEVFLTLTDESNRRLEAPPA